MRDLASDLGSYSVSGDPGFHPGTPVDLAPAGTVFDCVPGEVGEIVPLDVPPRLRRGRAGSGEVATSDAGQRLLARARPGYVRSVSADGSYVGTAVLISDPMTGDVEIVIHAPAAAEEAEADVMVKVCLLLSRQDVMNQGDVRAAVGGNHKKVDAALNRLVQGLYISESRGRRGAKLYRFLRMYHPINDLVVESDNG